MIHLRSNLQLTEPCMSLPVRPAVINAALDKRLAGLTEAKRFISTRVALHLRRAMDLKSKRTPPDTNQCILVMGPSGAGKTFLVEQVASIVKIPFASANAASLTTEGYSGPGINNVFSTLINKASSNNNLAQYGICLLDEWDKRVRPLHEKDGFSQGIQGEMLKIMEGTEVQIESRRNRERPATPFHTRGLMFVFAGSFQGLEQELAKGGKLHNVSGFAREDDASACTAREHALRDALVSYGLMPEFMNRLTGILALPTPTPADMISVLQFENGPLQNCNRTLRSLGVELAVGRRTAHAMAEHVCQTKTYCRGLRALLQAAADHLVYEDVKGVVSIEPDDLRRLASGARPRMTAPRCRHIDLNANACESTALTNERSAVA